MVSQVAVDLLQFHQAPRAPGRFVSIREVSLYYVTGLFKFFKVFYPQMVNISHS